jgi:hypothetical protein
MEPKGSLQYPEEVATGPISERSTANTQTDGRDFLAYFNYFEKIK